MRKISETLVSCIFLSGCVAIPHPVSPDVTIADQYQIRNNPILALRTSDLADDFSQKLAESSESIEIVDIEKIRAVTLLDEISNFETLIKPEVRRQLTEHFDLSYVVILSKLHYVVSEGEGFYIPLVIGAGKNEEFAELSSIIIDVLTGETVCKAQSVAKGTEHAATYVVIVVGNIPLVRSSAIKGLAKETAKVIDSLAKSKTVRIAVIIAESEIQDSH